MSALKRWLTNLVTFGLAHRLEADIRTQEENVQRMQAGKPRLTDHLNPISEGAFPTRPNPHTNGRRR